MARKPKYCITKEMLEEMHTEQKMTIPNIAHQIGCEHSLILHYLKKFAIPKLPKYERIEGQRFNRLLVIELSEVKNHQAIWKCRCECGNIVYTSTGRLKSGDVQSCGCLLKDSVTTHGMARTRPYRIWTSMKTRCTNQKQPNYKLYGGRGITYDPHWETFENFWNDMKVSYNDDLTLERIDNDAGYSKENCRWATRDEQVRNMRSNVIINYGGYDYCLTDLATKLDVPRGRLYYYHHIGLRGSKLIDQVMKLNAKIRTQAEAL
jgi:hypothetical protein